MGTVIALGRELGRSLFVLFLATVGIYLLVLLSPEGLDRLARIYGTADVSPLGAYLIWLKKIVLNLDFGKTLIQKDVFSEVMEKGRNTSMMIFFSLVFSGGFSMLFIRLGNRLQQIRAFSDLMTVIPYSLSALPAFIVGAVIIHAHPQLMYPEVLFEDMAFESPPVWPYYLVPAAILGITDGFLGEMMRHTKEGIERAMGESYIRLARAKGARLWHHIRYDLIIHISQLVFSKITMLISGTVVLEYMFSLPGVGGLAFNAAEQNDVNLLMGTLVILVCVVVAFSFLNRLIWLSVDPRMR